MNNQNKLTVPSNTFLPKQKDQLFTFGTYYRIREDGTIELGYGMGSKEGRRHDNTRLLVDPNPIEINGQVVYQCTVMWFRMDDTVYIPKGSKYDDARRDKKKVLMGIDEQSVFTDRNYYSFMMEELLDKDRVERYAEMGLQEHPSQPCGEYVGYVGYKDGQLTKFFSPNVGMECHNLPYMQELRGRIRDNKRLSQVRNLQELDDQIEKLNRQRNALLTGVEFHDMDIEESYHRGM